MNKLNFLLPKNDASDIAARMHALEVAILKARQNEPACTPRWYRLTNLYNVACRVGSLAMAHVYGNEARNATQTYRRQYVELMADALEQADVAAERAERWVERAERWKARASHYRRIEHESN